MVYGYAYKSAFSGWRNSFMAGRSGSGLMDNTLDYQSRDRKIDPRFPDLHSN